MHLATTTHQVLKETMRLGSHVCDGDFGANQSDCRQEFNAYLTNFSWQAVDLIDVGCVDLEEFHSHPTMSSDSSESSRQQGGFEEKEVRQQTFMSMSSSTQSWTPRASLSLSSTSVPPLSPYYSPGCRPTRLCSTDSVRSSSSSATGSVLQESLSEFQELQQRVAYNWQSDATNMPPPNRAVDADMSSSIVGLNTDNTVNVDNEEEEEEDMTNENNTEAVMEELRSRMGPMISLAMEEARREIDAVSVLLDISSDPSRWSRRDFFRWLRCMLTQQDFQSAVLCEENLVAYLFDSSALTKQDFHLILPLQGATADVMFAKLEIWRNAYQPSLMTSTSSTTTSTTSPTTETTLPSRRSSRAERASEYSESSDFAFLMDAIEPEELRAASESALSFSTSSMSSLEPTSSSLRKETFSSTLAPSSSSVPSPLTLPSPHAKELKVEDDSEDTETLTTCSSTPSTPTTPTSPSSLPLSSSTSRSTSIHLWQFVKELLAKPELYSDCVKWLDRNEGIFKIVDSHRVAILWGRRKNRPAMNYDKLSRSLRQYYKKGIMKKTERTQRLVYQFCPPYHL